MCGMCGYLGPTDTHAPPGARRAMRDSLTHRGPDGAGELEIRSERTPGLEGWLGHRRLRIIDLTGHADQPMLSDDGRVALTYNGEIYNFRELRKELRDRGLRFRSTGDTEVVLRAYEAWGEDCVRRLDGMFAFAIWDSSRGRLLLARDRTGKKPMFYAIAGGRITFGSEIKALLAAPWIEPELATGRLPEFLTFGYVPAPNTMYRGIHQLPPASILSFDAGGAHGPVEYWDPLPERQDLAARPDVRRRIARLTREATARRLVSDVPLGVLLSGGIDSSIVVGLMSGLSEERLRTFSIGFPEEPSYDERGYARQVADHFDTDHLEFAVKADAVALMDELLWHHDQPYADSSAIPTFLVCQLARQHVTVALNGDGGDEVFGGYDRFVAARIAEMTPGWLGPMAGPLTAGLPRNRGYHSLRRRAERFFERARQSPEARYQSWIAVFNEDLLRELTSLQARDRVTESMDRCYRRAADLPTLDRILYANFKNYLPDDLAVKMDRMSMASSLETRSPFLDTALIEYLARIPAADKVGMRRVKPLLRQAFWPLLPREIWNRRKHGFGVPMGSWFRSDLKPLFEDEVLSAGARTSELLDREVVSRLWREHQLGEAEHGFRFWTLLTLERWLRGLGKRQLNPPAAATVSG